MSVGNATGVDGTTQQPVIIAGLTAARANSPSGEPGSSNAGCPHAPDNSPNIAAISATANRGNGHA